MLIHATRPSASSPLRPRLILIRALKDTLVDDCLTMAAALSFYSFLALFPTLLFLVALTSFFPSDLLARLITSLGDVMPPSLTTLVWDQLQKVTARRNAGLLTIGFVGAIWGASAASAAVMSAVNRAYDLPASRSWLRQRLIAVLLMIVVSAFVLASFAVVISGPVADRVANRVGLGAAVRLAWRLLRWPAAFLVVSGAFAIVYYFGPERRQRIRDALPGALIGAVLWFIVSMLFKLYVVGFSGYNETYGAIAGAIAGLLWLYLSGLALLIGAEVNAEIQHARVEASPPGG